LKRAYLQDLLYAVSTLRIENKVRFVQRHPMLARQLVRQRACRRIPNTCDVKANCALRAVLCIYTKI
jgi:hypothetical protein